MIFFIKYNTGTINARVWLCILIELNPVYSCNLLSNQTYGLHIAGPGEEQLVVEDKGDIDGDIPADASETDDEINSNIGREIPAEISETDDEMEAEELLVDQDDHLQGAEDVSPDEDVQEAQMPEDVPANLRRSTRHSQRSDRWGHNIYDLYPFF